MEYNIITTNNDHEIIGNIYADLYINYSIEKGKEHDERKIQTKEKSFQRDDSNVLKDSWKSPSDLLIGKIQLKPAFTSKTTRGIAHEGILKIGDDILHKNHEKFLASLTGILQENDACWRFILKSEQEAILKKVKCKYENVFKNKMSIMSKEIAKFYEDTLKELELHVKTEVQKVTNSLHASMISYSNNQIRLKLLKERKIPEQHLNKTYVNEINKIEEYYDLLLKHEYERSARLTNYALNERNETLNVFYKQALCERLTSTMYVMCTERKKCKVKKILLEKYHSKEITDLMEKIKKGVDLLNSFKEKEVDISMLNNHWEEKIKKIVQLFLKFITFSLKLIPEQTQFLLDLEKMVHLQLEEVKSSAKSPSSLLLEEDDVQNIFNFDHLESSYSSHDMCEMEPFVIEGTLCDTPPINYGSRETLPLEVDLPIIRVQRKFTYAKCHGFEKITKFLQSKRCKCHSLPVQMESEPSISTTKTPLTQSSTSKSSDPEILLFEDIHRLRDCPEVKCTNLFPKNSFPYLNTYLDFSEENYKRVKSICSAPTEVYKETILIDAKHIANYDLPFSATKEKYHNVETQYCSEEDIRLPNHNTLIIEMTTSVCKVKEKRNIMVVRPSKYERLEAVRNNKKYWKNTLSQLHEHKNQPMDRNEMKNLSEVMSNELCDCVCSVLDFDDLRQSNEQKVNLPELTYRKLRKEPLLSYRKSIVIDSELDSDTDVEICSSEDEKEILNIHQQFLRKPVRDQITWNTRFLQPEREDQKSLEKKANDLTERITQEFCEYMKALGGDQQSQLFTSKTIKELFQVEFDTHVTRSLQIVPKEMPTVIDKVAAATGNLELSRNAALAREISKDIKAERRPDNLRAFGRSLPRQDQWRAPKNDTKNQWHSARHVPKDLVTLKTVWEGITNLRSVKEYCRWMIQHPEHRRAPYLNSLGMFDPTVLNSRLTMELQLSTSPPTTPYFPEIRDFPSNDNMPAPIEQLRRRLSELVDANQTL
ncbi:unnamed protein product [Parnassius apollo]|uniref:(apollo) hypothetical protein n=1 Tax=Parnassius apollo TaxID=110799 RepID=A0A8S3WKF5_PARAO|nr:unnamed protein product [Parnassius apollo]